MYTHIYVYIHIHTYYMYMYICITYWFCFPGEDFLMQMVKAPTVASSPSPLLCEFPFLLTFFL